MKLPKPGTVDRRQTLRPAGEVEAGAEEVVAVTRDLRDDLAEAERHDREVVAAKAKRRQADQHADERSHEPGGGQDQPDRDVKARARRRDADRAEVDPVSGKLGRREPAGHVGAHRVERDVAEVQQARVAHDDVQAEGHHREDQHHDHRVHPRARAEDRRPEQMRVVERVQDGEHEEDERHDPLAERQPPPRDDEDGDTIPAANSAVEFRRRRPRSGSGRPRPRRWS